MSIVLTIFLALSLAAYVYSCCELFGIPETLSDTYYRGARQCFTGLMSVQAFGLLAATLSDGRGLGYLAIVGAVGLLVVAFVPTFKHCGRCHWAHNAGAWLSAIGCVGWSISVSPWPTLFVASCYALYFVATRHKYAWLVAELSAFVCAYLTLLVS